MARLANGEEILEFTLQNRRGMQVKFITYGGIITSILVPDRGGRLANVALGFDNLAQYAGEHPYFGAITGRYANRIAGGRFVLDGIAYSLGEKWREPAACMAARSALTSEFGRRMSGMARWNCAITARTEKKAIRARWKLPLRYGLDEDNALRIDYSAETDAPTVLNLTNHSYFNLLGEGEGTIYNHILTLNADQLHAYRRGCRFPTGEIAPVDGTSLRLPHPQSHRSRAALGTPPDRQAQKAMTTILCCAAMVWLSDEPGFAARVYEPVSGRIMEVWTSEPGIQFYAGNVLDTTLVGSSGRLYRQSDGLALETQRFPDSPNQPHFPSTVLRPGERFQFDYAVQVCDRLRAALNPGRSGRRHRASHRR